jgi:hypothetical protein
MARKDMKINDVYDFIQVILKPGMVRFMLALEGGEKSSKELSLIRARKSSKVVDFLGLTKKHRDMNGIISYTLTQKGERVAKNLRSLYLSIDEILPKED